MNNSEIIKISVIVPVYNVEDYLCQCINSIINQSLKGIEILLIDDGSTDSSGKICDRYAKEYSNVQVYHKKNGGLGSARNYGLERANGKYVYFIDSDDYLINDALEKLYSESEKNELDVILFSGKAFSDDDSLKFEINKYMKTILLNTVVDGTELFIAQYRKMEYMASIPLRMYKTTYFKSHYVFPERIIHEDEWIGYESLINARRAESIPDVLYMRRYRKGSIMVSRSFLASCEGYIYSWCKLIDNYDYSIWKYDYRESVIMHANQYMDTVAYYYGLKMGRKDRQCIELLIRKIKVNNFDFFVNEMKFSTRLFIRVPKLYNVIMYPFRIIICIRDKMREKNV